eukprot:6761386-Pyramimonas_sp.AAC.1
MFVGVVGGCAGLVLEWYSSVVSDFAAAVSSVVWSALLGSRRRHCVVGIFVVLRRSDPVELERRIRCARQAARMVICICCHVVAAGVSLLNLPSARVLVRGRALCR